MASRSVAIRAASHPHYAVATDCFRSHAQLSRLLRERAAGGIHAAIHDRVGIFALDLREDGAEVDRLVIRRVVRQHFQVVRFRRFAELGRKTLSLRRGIVDDSDRLYAKAFRRISRECRPLLGIRGNNAKCRIEVLQRVGRVRCGLRDFNDACILVDTRRGNRRTGV